MRPDFVSPQTKSGMPVRHYIRGVTERLAPTPGNAGSAASDCLSGCPTESGGATEINLLYINTSDLVNI